MKRQEEDVSIMGPIINDTRRLLPSFPKVRASHVQREANQVAHRLACTESGSDTEMVWFEDPSDLIMDALLEDCPR
ncbi:hypothetical protein ACFX2F_006659 [Malus domestica]